MSVQEIFLKPGEWHFGDASARIRTILGSCVAFTFWHRQLLLGGMCHYMLPERMQTPPPGHTPDGRYGDEALLLINRAIMRRGGVMSDYEVKLFGGATMFASDKQQETVSARNIEMARRLVEHYRLRVAAHHLGGQVSRHLVFDIGSGDVFLKTGAALPGSAFRE